MKPVVSFAFFLALVTLCYALSQPIIRDTRAEGCVEDSHCGSHCAWDGAKIFPGDQLNQPGKCRHLTCTKEFDIRITPCPVDLIGEDSHCESHCAYEGAKIFPGDQLNQPGKCRHLTCTKELDVRITPCPVDVTGEFEWIGKDNTKLYPECCGTKSKKHN